MLAVGFDCGHAYNTMLELKTILEKLEFKLEEMIEICPSAKDKTENFLISSRIRVEQTKVTREDRQTRKQNAAKRKIGQTMWGDLYREHKPLLEDLNSVGKFLTISGEMKEHHEELKNLIQIIKDKLKLAGLKIVQMTGSGSCVFALSTDKRLIYKVAKELEKQYLVEVTKVIK